LKTKLPFACFFALTMLAAAEDDRGLAVLPVPFERGFRTPPAISIFYNPNYAGVDGRLTTAVVVCIMPDGRAVWSRDHIKGGPPYFTGHIARKRLAKFFDALNGKGVFARRYWFLVAIDAPEHDINIIAGRRRIGLVASTFDFDRKTPDRITDVDHAYAFVRHEIERLLPRKGRQLRAFHYQMRMGYDGRKWTKSIFQ
jgi:hypothetical protein